MEKVIYLDNAATTFPKPECVIEAAVNYATRIGASPGRSGHRLSIEASRILFRARERIAEILGVEDSSRVIFTKNATEALNVVINGLLSNCNGNVVVTSLEHNSVMRPLKRLEKKGLKIRMVFADSKGIVKVEDVMDAIDGDTKAVFMNHASNAFGVITPVFDVALETERKGIPLVVDLTQILGCYPVNFSSFRFVIPVFTGHKALYGLQGTGGFYLPEAIDFDPLICGGTGSYSELDEQPDFLPDKFESGTPNTVGIASLEAGVSWVLENGVERIRKHELLLTEAFISSLLAIKNVCVYGDLELARRISVVSINIKDLDPAEVSYLLDRRFGIMTRPGLHCAPWAHRSVGTFPVGTVRFSFGFFNTESDVECAVDAVKEIAEGRR